MMKVRIWSARLILALFAIFIPSLPGQAWAGQMADENAYAFVHYGGDRFIGGLGAFIDRKVEYVGAGWIQAEGPQMSPGGSPSVAWTNVAPVYVPDPSTGQCGTPPVGAGDFSKIDAWVDVATDRGMGVVLSINTSDAGDNKSCWVKGCTQGKLNCVPRDWNQWYRFVHEVVRHFDGHNGPQVKYFTSVQEADQFYPGGAADLLGGPNVKIDRTLAGYAAVSVPAGIVPVAHLAVQDAGTGAAYVLGSIVGSGVQPALVHLYEQWKAGVSRSELNKLARSYNIPLEARPTDLRYFFNTTQLVRDRRLVRPSFDAADNYDIYSIHLYDSYYGYKALPLTANHPYATYLAPEGFQQVLFWIADQIPGKELWITGTGLAPNPYLSGGHTEAEAEAYLTNHVVKTLTVAHAVGVASVTYSGIYHNGLTEGLWDGLEPGVTPRKREAADAFRMMAGIFPTKNSITDKQILEYRSGQGWQVKGPGETDPWSSEALLYIFDVTHPDASTGHAVTGWCVDQNPSDPTTFTPPGGSGCTTIADVRNHFGMDASPAVAVYDSNGALRDCRPANSTDALDVAFEQAPFVITWGSDRDGNCEPDISDPSV